MKGIVVEIIKNEAVILTDEGIFTNVKNHNYAVGQTAELRVVRKTYKKLTAAAATMAAAFAVCTIGAYAWFTPTDYVSMDVNPSVEYSLNVFDRILEVKGVNDDGDEILENLDLKNMTIEDAVKETLDKLIDDGYLTDDPDGGVVITTSNDQMGDAEQLAEELEQEIQVYLDSKDGITVAVDAEAVAPDRVEEAKDLGVTPGKLNLVEKLQASTMGAISDEEFQDWLKRPVKEINKAIKENRKAGKEVWESDDRPDSEETTTDGGLDLNGKPEKQDKERSNNKNKSDDSNEDIDGTVWRNDQNLPADNENNKQNNSSNEKANKQNNDEQNTDQMTEDTESKAKKPKEDGKQGKGYSSDKDQND